MAKGRPNKRNQSENQLNNLKGVQNRKKKAAEPKPEPDPNMKRRRDWETNHEIITSLYTELLLKKGKPPSITEISRRTKLSWLSVYNHLENFDFDQVKMIFRMGNQAVYMNMFKQAATSKNPRWAELFLRWNGDIQQKVDVTSGGKPLPAPPALQGVVKLDPKKLPTEVLEKIIQEHGKPSDD